ncbi:MAG TPA: FecR family protein [Niabella sp.]|nr:FecR family protein [Niabella sp.]
MSYNRFLELILKKKSGKLSSKEQDELNRFLLDNPSYYELSGMVDQLYSVPINEIKEVDQTYLQKRWVSLKNKAKIKETPGGKVTSGQKRFRLRYFYLAVTSIAAVLLLAVFLLLNQHDFSAKDVVVATKMGSKTSMRLPDGSTVWLNAGSKISYSDDFGKKSRDVQLSGEAYFDVAHDAECPFVVHTQDFDIKVLGTTFNVKAYEGDGESQTTLVKGLIELSINNKDAEKIILRPNEKLIVKNPRKIEKETVMGKPNATAEIKITGLEKSFHDSQAIETQWLDNCLAFRDSKFKDVAVLISRWYGVSVEIKDEKLNDKEFSGMFKDESLEQVMHALKLAGGFDYTIDKNIVTIVSKT